MSQVTNNGKIEELQKKRKRLEKEFNSAKKKLEQQKQAVVKKENELKKIDTDLVSALLVENGLSMEDLTSLLSQTKSSNESSFEKNNNFDKNTSEQITVEQPTELGGE